MRKFLLPFLMLAALPACAGDGGAGTLWNDLPDSIEERYQYFKKADRTGRFERYEDLRGTKFLVACIYPVSRYVRPVQRDDVSNLNQVKNLADSLCRIPADPVKEFRAGEESKDLEMPYGTAVILDFHLDEEASKAYREMKGEWTLFGRDEAKNAESFLYHKNVESGGEGIKVSRILYNSLVKSSEYGSFTAEKVVDCRNMRWQLRGITLYERKYAKGKVLYHSPEAADWETAKPGTPIMKAMETVCAR